MAPQHRFRRAPFASQSRNVRSSRKRWQRHHPRGTESLVETGSSWPDSVSSGAPLRVSHIFAEPSSDVLSIRSPAALKTARVTTRE